MHLQILSIESNAEKKKTGGYPRKEQICYKINLNYLLKLKIWNSSPQRVIERKMLLWRRWRGGKKFGFAIRDGTFIIVISYEVSMVYDTETQIKLLGSIFCNPIYYVNILLKKKKKILAYVGTCPHYGHATLYLRCNFLSKGCDVKWELSFLNCTKVL